MLYNFIAKFKVSVARGPNSIHTVDINIGDDEVPQILVDNKNNFLVEFDGLREFTQRIVSVDGSVATLDISFDAPSGDDAESMLHRIYGPILYGYHDDGPFIYGWV